MNLSPYLIDLLGAQKAWQLLNAIAAGKTILVSGPNGPTGKSTLCRVLKKAGASAVEQGDVYEVNVHELLKNPTPHMEDFISV